MNPKRTEGYNKMERLSITLVTLLVVLLQQTQASLLSSSNLVCDSANQLLCFSRDSEYYSDDFATTSSGRVYPSLLHSQTVGKWGSPLLQDVYLLEKLQAMTRERIPARIAHAKASGAFGYFKAFRDVSKYTKAAFLKPGVKTDVVVRFSTQVGESGSADTAVDARGFAVKMYTRDGNYDFVGLNVPVFGLRDAITVPDILHTRMKNPQTHQLNFNAYWDFASEQPETFLFTLFFFARTAYPQSYRYMDGHAINTFTLVNNNNKPTFAKFIFTSDTKDKKYFTTLEALNAAGLNPEFHTQDLYDSIAAGNYPSWTLNLQLMTYEQAARIKFSPFDATKYWNTTAFPLLPVGRMVLDRNPTNYFNDVEQAAFCPGNLVPGIEPSPDRLLASRMFAYRDAQLYRLGVNFNQIPVNRCPFGTKNYERDGFMNIGTNGGNSPNFFPNSFKGVKSNTEPYYNELSLKMLGDIDRYNLSDEDNSSLCQMYINSLNAEEVQELLDNAALSFTGVYPEIRQKVIEKLFLLVSKNFANQFKETVKRFGV